MKCRPRDTTYLRNCPSQLLVLTETTDPDDCRTPPGNPTDLSGPLCLGPPLHSVGVVSPEVWVWPSFRRDRHACRNTCR